MEAAQRDAAGMTQTQKDMTVREDSLLRLAHHISQGPGTVETFTFGTRVTHITRALDQPEADRAIIAAGQQIPDWSGGTRLADGLHVFLQRWGRRGMASLRDAGRDTGHLRLGHYRENRPQEYRERSPQEEEVVEYKRALA